jgi:hypothetical protein
MARRFLIDQNFRDKFFLMSWFESLALASHPLQPASLHWEVRCGGTPQPARETHALPKFVFTGIHS